MSINVEPKPPEVIEHGVVTFIGHGGINSISWDSYHDEHLMCVRAEVFSSNDMGKGELELTIPLEQLGEDWKHLYSNRQPKVRLMVEIEY